MSTGYDIVAFPPVGTERDLAIVVGLNGHRTTVENALSNVASFGLSRSEGISIERTMQKIVKTSWEGLCVNNGFTALEIDRLRTCFIACDEVLLGSGSVKNRSNGDQKNLFLLMFSRPCHCVSNPG